MGLKTFIGGVHPYEGKELAKDAPIKEVLPKGELVFPLSQHIGAPATPIVAVGDSVKKGQKIAEAGGFVSSPIYSSVSGTVKKIEPRRVAVGDMVNSIVIESDGQFTECEYSPVDDVTSLSREKIIDRIKEADVVGMGGAGFPTHVKLSPKEPEKIEYIIANCAECEPYLTADYRRMIETPEDLVAGMKIIQQLFDHAKGVFGVSGDCSNSLHHRHSIFYCMLDCNHGIYVVHDTACICRKHFGIDFASGHCVDQLTLSSLRILCQQFTDLHPGLILNHFL